MVRAAHKRSSVGTLLILAAIDMLTASLVCAVVLFLVLVGSESNEAAATPGRDMFNAPSIAFVYFDGPTGPRLGNTQAAPVESTSHDEPVLRALLGTPPYSLQTYQLKGGEHQLVIEQSSTVTLLEIYPGNGAPLRLVVACKIFGTPLTVSFGSEAAIDGACAPNDVSPDVIYPENTRIRFTAQPGKLPQVALDDWEPAQSNVPTPQGGWLLTLRAKRTASSQALGISAKIAEVLQ